MAYKAFAENEINPRPFVEEQTISISEDSPCASHVHLLTGVRSLGKVNVFKSGTNPAFNEIDPKEIKYQWDFDNQALVDANTEKIILLFLKDFMTRLLKMIIKESI